MSLSPPPDPTSLEIFRPWLNLLYAEVTGQPQAEVYSPSAAGTAYLNLNKSNHHVITMPAGNITIAVGGASNYQRFTISILQDATGSRTVTWWATIRWAGGSAPTLTTTASKRDTFEFIRTGTDTYDGFIIGQNT